MRKDFNFKILDKIVLTGVVLTLVALLVLPWELPVLLKSKFGILDKNIPMIISVSTYICAIPYVWALILLKKLSGLVAKKDAFSASIPQYLKDISICSFSEILIFNIVQLGLYYLFDIYLGEITVILVVVVSFVSLAVGFLSLVLSKLFEIAIEIKDENDKTI